MSNHDLPGAKSDSSSREGGPAASPDQAKAPLYMGSFRNLPVQRKLNVGAVDDPMEKEADEMADELRRKPFVPGGGAGGAVKDAGGETGGLAVPAPLAQGIESARGSGEALPEETRDFMAARFGADFSGVRIHTGEDAAKFSGALNAQAFTLGEDVFFNRGKFSPYTAEGQHLLAHELAHTVQQRRAGVGADRAEGHELRRKVEFRPPGKGEANAFPRAQEIIDRLNKQSAAIQYKLDGHELKYTIVDAANLTFFDRMMRKFIDEDQTVPLRLITGEGKVGGGGVFVPVLIDSFNSGYVDVDDLMATDEQSFQNWFTHILTERFHVKRYAHLLGTPDINPLFEGAHAAAQQAEAQRLQDVLRDPFIRFVFEEIKPDGKTAERGFRSKPGKYSVFLVTHNVGSNVSRTEMFVIKADGTRLSLEDFRKEREAAVPAPAKPAPAVP